MKKILSAALCAATLAFGLTGAAHADQFVPVILKLPTTPGSMTATGTFSDKFTEAAPFFDDAYLYANVPAFSLDEFSVVGKNVAFDSVTLYAADYSMFPDLFGTGNVGDNHFDLMTAGPLPSALWILEITGSADAGGSYSGTIFSTAIDTPPIPEPTNALLLLAGLGAVAARVKRSRRSAVAA